MKSPARRLLLTVKRGGNAALILLASMAFIVACSSKDGPAICSGAGIQEVRNAGASDDVIAKLCAKSGRGSPVDAQTGKPRPDTAGAFQKLKFDRPNNVGRPFHVDVAVKPSDYYNFKYRDAQATHYSFDICPIQGDGNVNTSACSHGYAKRAWAGSYFERLLNDLKSGQYGYKRSSAVIAVLRSRYSPDDDSCEVLTILPGLADLEPDRFEKQAAESQ